MFDDKENLIGIVFLAVCAVVAGVFIWEITTGNRLVFNGPRWILWIVGAVFIGGILYGVVQSFTNRRQGQGMTQWPNPAAGRRPWWRRILNRDE